MSARTPRRGVLVAAALVASVSTLAASLGAWQLERRDHAIKRQQNLQIAQTKPPIKLKEAQKYPAEDYKYRIQTQGRIRDDLALRLQATLNGGPAWKIIAPMIVSSEHAHSRSPTLLLVERGTLRAENLNPNPFPDASINGRNIKLVAFIRQTETRRGNFIPNDDPIANVWHAADVTAMLNHITNADTTLRHMNQMPFLAVAQSETNLNPDDNTSASNLKLKRQHHQSPRQTLAPSRHLGYAITWFALAVAAPVIAIGAAVANRRQRHTTQTATAT